MTLAIVFAIYAAVAWFFFLVFFVNTRTSWGEVAYWSLLWPIAWPRQFYQNWIDEQIERRPNFTERVPTWSDAEGIRSADPRIEHMTALIEATDGRCIRRVTRRHNLRVGGGIGNIDRDKPLFAVFEEGKLLAYVVHGCVEFWGDHRPSCTGGGVDLCRFTDLVGRRFNEAVRAR